MDKGVDILLQDAEEYHETQRQEGQYQSPWDLEGWQNPRPLLPAQEGEVTAPRPVAAEQQDEVRDSLGSLAVSGERPKSEAVIGHHIPGVTGAPTHRNSPAPVALPHLQRRCLQGTHTLHSYHPVSPAGGDRCWGGPGGTHSSKLKAGWAAALPQ